MVLSSESPDPDLDPVALLESMIAIGSVNPRGRAEPAEAELAHFIADWAGRLGMAVELDEVRDGRLNVIVTLPGTEPGRSVLLESHLDTVELPAGRSGPTVMVTDARVFGRGACDAKGSLAAFMAAMGRLRLDERPGPTVRLAGVIDEEHHYRGVVDLLARHDDLWSDCVGAIVGEPTELRVVAAHKGVIRCRLEATGPGGHSSRGQHLANPVVAVARAITTLHDRADALIGPSVNPLVGPGTLAVTMVNGGLGENTIPDSCAAVIDRRLAPGEDPQTCWEALRDCVARHVPDVTVCPPHTVDPSLSTDPADPFVVALLTAAEATHGHGEAVGADWGSDASKLAAAGIPTVVWGPGSIDQAHTDGEYLEIGQLSEAVTILTGFLRSL